MCPEGMLGPLLGICPPPPPPMPEAMATPIGAALASSTHTLANFTRVDIMFIPPRSPSPATMTQRRPPVMRLVGGGLWAAGAQLAPTGGPAY